MPTGSMTRARPCRGSSSARASSPPEPSAPKPPARSAARRRTSSSAWRPSRPDGGGFVLPLGGGESLAFESVDLSGRIAPSGGVTRLDLVGRAAGLSVDGISAPAIGLSLAIEAEGDNPLADRTLPFAFRAEADSIDVAGRTIPGGEATPLVLTAQGTLDLDAMSAATTASLDIAGGKVTYAGTIAAGDITGRAEAVFTEIAPLAGLFGQPVRGGVSLTAEGSFAGTDGLDLKVEARTSGLDTGEAVLTKLLGAEPRISATVSDSPDGAMAIADLAVEGAQVSLSGGGSLAGSIIDATLNGRIADLGVLAEGTTGAADLAAKVTGALDAPNIDATITIAEGTLLDQTIADASLRFEGAPTDSGWQGALTLGGTLAGQPLAGTARAEVAAGGGLSFPDIDLTVAENRITGAVAQTADGLALRLPRCRGVEPADACRDGSRRRDRLRFRPRHLHARQWPPGPCRELRRTRHRHRHADRRSYRGRGADRRPVRRPDDQPAAPTSGRWPSGRSRSTPPWFRPRSWAARPASRSRRRVPISP